MSKIPSDQFFSSVPVFSDFEGVTDAKNYRPLPDDWVLALADIVGSTGAIAHGKYKDVNMAGVSVISAVLNAIGGGDYPFLFGGDGAEIAIPGIFADAARHALGAVRAWVAEELNLSLRIAVVPVADIRAAGLDVLVARYAASSNVSYAMFLGGGTNWAEQQMRAGGFGVAEVPPGTRPDLTGLSCRWSPIESRHGEIVSIIAVPSDASSGDESARPAFQRLVADIIAITSDDRGGHPVSAVGPDLAFSLAGVERETQAAAPQGQRLFKRLGILGQIGLTMLLHTLNIPLGRFDARKYRADVAANSDFRKFDDGLRMTIDIGPDRLRRVEALLKDAQDRGIARFGLHKQRSALMTCFVPTPLSADHMHFIDGADGGYAAAASQISGKSSSGDGTGQ